MNLRNIVFGAIAGLAIGVVFAACGDNNNPCNSTTCSTGCCTPSGVCETGNTVQACGTAGGVCSVCTATQVCQAAVCVNIGGNADAGMKMDAGMMPMDAGMDAGMMPTDAGMDAGMTGMDAGMDAGMTGTAAVGAECTMNGDCASGLCADETSTMGLFPGGYCTADCTNTACPSGSDCTPYLSSSGGLCLENCTTPGSGQDTCRDGYVCDKNWVPTPDQGSCFPACDSTDQCSDDGSVVCESGYCCGADSYKCCAGNVCNDGSTCGADGYCAAMP